MTTHVSDYDLFKKKLFDKLSFRFTKGKKMLDVGCGDGGDSKIFIDHYHLKTCATDLFEDKNIKKIKNLHFIIGNIYNIPYKESSFDYIFLHNVLHHIDEKSQSFKKHVKALEDLKRVCKHNGEIIIIEANRYNPLFYPHMVLLGKHNHFTQRYFKKLIMTVFPHAEFRFFENHLYPKKSYWFWNIYEKLMEKYSPRKFLSYNVAVIKNEKK